MFMLCPVAFVVVNGCFWGLNTRAGCFQNALKLNFVCVLVCVWNIFNVRTANNFYGEQHSNYKLNYRNNKHIEWQQQGSSRGQTIHLMTLYGFIVIYRKVVHDTFL